MLNGNAHIKPDANLAISVRHLSKSYQLRKANKLFGVLAYPGKGSGEETESFQALSDISFDLMAGEVVGIIGSNGSGKSTLLKILSEITKPSSGTAVLQGSVVSILDIGSNFHPDLTGRENAMMQMRIRGIESAGMPELLLKIWEYSGIDEFFDQPVKLYSSGMFLRLAFSVAFHISSDILLLDEVLSVGDEGFRLKSQSLIKQLKATGKTILFVSHNRNEILELCDKCIWLEKGRVKKMGYPGEVLGEYFELQQDNFEAAKAAGAGKPGETGTSHDSDGIDMKWKPDLAPGNQNFKVLELEVSCSDSHHLLFTSESTDIRIVIEKLSAGISITPLVVLHDVFGQPVIIAYPFNNISHENFMDAFKEDKGLLEFQCSIPPNFLAPGTYQLSVRFGMNVSAGNARSQGEYVVEENLRFRLRNRPGQFDFVGNSMNGSVRPALNWKFLKRG